MEIKFCRRCGRPVELKDKREGLYRCQGGHTLYYRGYTATLVLLINERNEVLLGVRGIDPGKGLLDLPGGFTQVDETLEKTVARELEEETGLKPADYGTLEYLLSGADQYEYGGEVQSVLTAVFWGRLASDAKFVPHDDVTELVWRPLHEVGRDELPSGANTVWLALKAMRKRQG